MSRCIYCNNDENTATFRGREHVIPKLMGVFENNLTIRGWVCDICNSKTFSELETRFKEDTEEGIFYQMYNLNKSSQIRIRGKNIKMTFSSGLGDSFFDEIFPFFNWEDGDWKIVLLPQIKIKRFGEHGYLVLLVDELKKQSSKKISAIKNLLRGIQSKDVSIFVGGDSEKDDGSFKEAIDLVRELGIDYKEKKRKFKQLSDGDRKRKFNISMDCTVNNDVGRVIAKIAFNYFAYCALEGGNESIIFHPNFDKIKSYIIGEADLPIKDVITALDCEPIIYDEAIKKMRIVGHTVVFSEENRHVVAKVSFLGKRIYTVALGKIPDELRRDGFGCGHLFDPINKKIFGLTQNESKWGSGQEPGFGLFCRV